MSTERTDTERITHLEQTIAEAFALIESLLGQIRVLSDLLSAAYTED